MLWHLAMSHYNEKARWALDWKQVPHTRRATVPGVHAVVASRLAGSSTFPILQIGDSVFSDSTDIVAALNERWPARPLLPADPTERQRALELEEQFDSVLAPAIRSLVYQHLLIDPALSAKFLAVGGGRGRELALRLVQPVMASKMRQLFRVPPVGDQQPLETVISEVEKLLQEPRFNSEECSAIDGRMPTLQRMSFCDENVKDAWCRSKTLGNQTAV